MSRIGGVLRGDLSSKEKKIELDKFQKIALVNDLIKRFNTVHDLHIENNKLRLENKQIDILDDKVSNLVDLNAKLTDEALLLRDSNKTLEKSCRDNLDSIAKKTDEYNGLSEEYEEIKQQNQQHFALYKNEELLNNSRKQDLLNLINSAGNGINILKGLVNMLDSTQEQVSNNEIQRIKINQKEKQ